MVRLSLGVGPKNLVCLLGDSVLRIAKILF
jgi:hypothetical protein